MENLLIWKLYFVVVGTQKPSQARTAALSLRAENSAKRDVWESKMASLNSRQKSEKRSVTEFT